jgi:predicted amidohydrolase
MTLLECIEFGSDRERGNLVGIQPYLVPADYRNESAFHAKLDTYFAEAKKRGWLGSKTVAVLPEYVGSWLIVADERSSVFAAKSMEVAMLGLIFNNFRAFVRHLIHAHGKDRIKYSLFRMKAETIARIYHNVFSRLARDYSVTVVGGSVVLPAVEVQGSSLKIIEGHLFNTTLMYRPDGTAYPEVLHKIYPTPQELPFTEPGSEDRLPVYETPAGRMGVLNCADSWYATPYLKLRGKIDFLAVPSFVEKDGNLAMPWSGNNITPKPPEFEPSDYRKITYDDAWIKYSMAARIHTADVRYGMNVFLRGEFWGMGSDGRSIIWNDGKLVRGKEGAGAAIQNLWLT